MCQKRAKKALFWKKIIFLYKLNFSSSKKKSVPKACQKGTFSEKACQKGTFLENSVPKRPKNCAKNSKKLCQNCSKSLPEASSPNLGYGTDTVPYCRGLQYNSEFGIVEWHSGTRRLYSYNNSGTRCAGNSIYILNRRALELASHPKICRDGRLWQAFWAVLARFF